MLNYFYPSIKKTEIQHDAPTNVLIKIIFELYPISDTLTKLLKHKDHWNIYYDKRVFSPLHFAVLNFTPIFTYYLLVFMQSNKHFVLDLQMFREIFWIRIGNWKKIEDIILKSKVEYWYWFRMKKIYYFKIIKILQNLAYLRKNSIIFIKSSKIFSKRLYTVF